MTAQGTLIREFKTANFRVIVDAVDDPDLDLSFDEDGSVARGLDSGAYIAFNARARVFHADLGEIAADYLGGCIYESLEDFKESSGYLPGMVHEVCRQARGALLRMREGINVLTIRGDKGTNARLAIATPDMLASLRQLVDVIRTYRGDRLPIRDAHVNAAVTTANKLLDRLK